MHANTDITTNNTNTNTATATTTTTTTTTTSATTTCEALLDVCVERDIHSHVHMCLQENMDTNTKHRQKRRMGTHYRLYACVHGLQTHAYKRETWRDRNRDRDTQRQRQRQRQRHSQRQGQRQRKRHSRIVRGTQAHP